MTGPEGRSVIVTGASRGIGRAVTDQLVASGARVVIDARDEAVLAEVAVSVGQ